jgi:hypothetical protein
MFASQKGNSAEKQNVNVELVGKANQALELARAFSRRGDYLDACEMYDAAFGVFATELGETHRLTLESQREYGALLTINHMAAEVRRRRMN